MSFCYQKIFVSPTEKVTPQVFTELFTSAQTKWLIGKYRQITADSNWKKWLNDSDYQQWLMRERRLADSDEDRVKQWAQSLKKSLPAVMFQANFMETMSKNGFKGRWRKQAATCLTGLVVMDIDHVDNPRELLKNYTAEPSLLCKLGILLVYITPSGHGLKIVFKARTEWGNLIDNQHAMAKELGVEVDESCKDASRMSFVSTYEDILYINQELFTYENKDFAEKYNDTYRHGNSRPTADLFADDAAVADDTAVAGNADVAGNTAGSGNYQGHPIQAYIDHRYKDCLPCKNDHNRHSESLKLAYDLLIMLDGDKQQVETVIRQQPWVEEIVKERGENVRQTVESAAERLAERERKVHTPFPSTNMQRAIAAVSGMTYKDIIQQKAATNEKQDVKNGMTQLPLAEWGQHIRLLSSEFPCLTEICRGRDDATLPAIVFASAAMLGTLMTRTWYHFYHRPQQERRLNYAVYIIGDPGCGKSDIGDLFSVLMAPIADSDKVGIDALNRWKREKNERQSSTKEMKKEALKKPEVVIRIHPARTANGVFIEDMVNAVELVGQKMMHLHLFTFDAELDNSTKLSGKGSANWINKEAMELKAFHNEKDGQAYANSDSVMGEFDVFWNFIYTGTMVALRRKITADNFGQGMPTRMAVMPMPSSDYKMMELKEPTEQDVQDERVLSEWAYRLDKVKGELPVWTLVKECWEWTRDHMVLASVNQDKADELLLKRVAYYGIAVSVPFILMRHWEEWSKDATFTIDETDKELCRLALNMQYQTQHYFFGEYAFNYFVEQERNPWTERKRQTKTLLAYAKLPDTFALEDVEKCYEKSSKTAYVIIHRLIADGCIRKSKTGKNAVYTKIKNTL